MKILHVTTILNTVNLFLIPHIKFLIDQGNEVGIACNTINEETSTELSKLDCTIRHVPFNRNPLNKENLLAYRQIQEIIKNEGFEMVHVHTPVASLLTRIACRKIPNIMMLYTAHGFHFFNGSPKKNQLVYYPLEKFAAKWTDGLITMNEEDYASAKKFKLRKKNSIYKVNGIGLELCKYPPQTLEMKNTLRREYDFNEEDFILINVGELSYRKHQDLIIKAIGKLEGRIPNLKLLLVGAGNQEESYRELASSLSLENEIRFLGYRKDIQQLLLLSDIAVSTSRQEGLPVNVMEAMSTGLPLIATDCRGNRDLVVNGVNGFLIGVDDVDACAKAIENLSKSENLRRTFSNKNKELIKGYSTESVIEEMKEIYREQIILET